jgi:ankyrin repeat protein
MKRLISVRIALAPLTLAALSAGAIIVTPIAAHAAPTRPAARQQASSSALLDAVRAGDLAAVQAALAAGANVNDADPQGRRTPLMLAAEAGRTDLVQLLLENKADVNARDADGRTALHHILAAAKPDVTNTAPEQKPKKKRGFGGLGNLGKALAGDALSGKAVGELVKGQALHGLINKNLGQSLLGIGDLKSLLGPGATFDLASRQNWSAVLGAALVGNESAVRGDLATLNTKDAGTWTRLLQAAGKQQPELLATLGNVSTSPGVTDATRQQWAAFVRAASGGDTATAQALLADKQLTNLLGAAGQGLTAAADAHLPGRDGGRSIVEALLARGASLSAADARGETPVVRARKAGLSTVTELLEKAAR